MLMPDKLLSTKPKSVTLESLILWLNLLVLSSWKWTPSTVPDKYSVVQAAGRERWSWAWIVCEQRFFEWDPEMAWVHVWRLVSHTTANSPQLESPNASAAPLGVRPLPWGSPSSLPQLADEETLSCIDLRTLAP